MSITHTIFAIIFAAVTVAGGLLTADELVRLRRRRGNIWDVISTPAAQRLRFCLFIMSAGVAGLTFQWSIVAVSGAAVAIMLAIVAWNVWVTVRGRRQSRSA